MVTMSSESRGSAAEVPVESTPAALTSVDLPSRPQVVAPGPGRAISEFASEVGQILAATNEWFIKSDRVVWLREVQGESGQGTGQHIRSNVFQYPSANELRSSLELFVEIGARKVVNGMPYFVRQSLSKETAAALLESPQFKETLPQVQRVLDVPIPVDIDGELQMVQPGYDPRLQLYCRRDVEGIVPLELAEAKSIIGELLEGFPFANELSKHIAIARMLSPMCRGLMGWSARTPLWVFEANRPRAGKDYLAGCTGQLYEGRANEDSPLDKDPNETKKRILAALQSGRRFMHFANTSGDIENDAFEQAVTAKMISGRLLGSNDANSDLTLPNELEFSVSGNTGFNFSEDFALRCRRISLAYYVEDANTRTFPKPDLHGWILANRGRILGALAGLIWEWDRQGRKLGPTPFTSFPEWARIVGGVMAACELGDPCLAQNEGTFTRDRLTEDMTGLFELGNSMHQGEWLTGIQVRRLVSGPIGSTEERSHDLFPQWDLDDRAGQTKFGSALQRYKNRELGGIRMEADDTDRKRVKYRFVPINGTVVPPRPPTPSGLAALGR